MNSLPLLFCLLFFPVATFAADFEITPFNTGNQSPLVRIFGLPRDTGSDVVPPGKYKTSLSHDLSSNYTVNYNAKSRESITLDSEVNQVTFTTSYGVYPRLEAGVEIPYILQGGGFLDNFIVDWHKTFGLPQGGRDIAPDNRVNYSYYKNGVQKLRMDRASSGVGDISLTGGFSLYDVSDAAHHNRMALKGAVKLPTGDSAYLLGSGSTDFLLQLCGSMNSFGDYGALGVYGSAGALAMTKSDVLRDQHRPIAGTGTVGLGWGPASWISFKVQLNGTTPLYKESSLTEISKSSLLVTFGGALKFPGEYLLDIGVGEDLNVGTAPDVTFHLGLSKLF